MKILIPPDDESNHSVPQTSKHLRGCVQSEGSHQTEGKYTELKSLVGTSCCPAAWLDQYLKVHIKTILNKSEKRSPLIPLIQVIMK